MNDLYVVNQGHTVDSICPAVCPQDWAHIDSSCYKAWRFDGTPDTADRSWTAARGACMVRGGDLVSIGDANENMIVNVIRRVRLLVVNNK